MLVDTETLSHLFDGTCSPANEGELCLAWFTIPDNAINFALHVCGIRHSLQVQFVNRAWWHMPLARLWGRRAWAHKYNCPCGRILPPDVEGNPIQFVCDSCIDKGRNIN